MSEYRDNPTPVSNERSRDMLRYGAERPYESEDNPTPAPDWAHAAARGVMYDFSDRRGIRQAFDSIDDDVRLEIVETMADIIREAAMQAGIIHPTS